MRCCCVHSDRFNTDIEYYKDDIDNAIYGPGCTAANVFGVGDDGRAYNIVFVPDDDEWESYHFDDRMTELFEEEP